MVNVWCAMAALALLVGIDPANRKVKDAKGVRHKLILPKDRFFDELLQQHSLVDERVPKPPGPFREVSNNSVTSSFIVKLQPDLEFEGPLTAFDSQCMYLWKFFHFPADPFTLKIERCLKLLEPVVLATARRQAGWVWLPEIIPNLQGLQGIVLPGQKKVLKDGDLPLALGVSRDDWCAFQAQPLCICIPKLLLKLVELSAWCKIMLQAGSFSARGTPALHRLRMLLNFPSQAWFDQLKASGRLGLFLSPTCLPLGASHAASIAHEIRQVAPILLQSVSEEEDRSAKRLHLESMVSRLDSFSNALDRASGNRKHPPRALLACLSAGMQLRNRKHLRITVESAIQAIFPACEFADDVWEKIPSASTLSRAQLLVDASLCCLMRRRFEEMNHCDASIFMFADSSPQAGSDWLLSTCNIIPGSSLDSCMQAAWQLKSDYSWAAFLSALHEEERDTQDDVVRIVTAREDLGSRLRQMICTHRCLPMALGSGATSLEHKCRCIARALFAEAQSLPLLKGLLSGVVSVTTDMGVELGVGDAAGLAVEEVLPSWMHEPLSFDCDDNSGFEKVRPAISEHFLPRALVIPGLNHIIDNMCSDANHAMQDWDSWLQSFRPVVALLHHSHLRKRFVASCVRGTQHAWMEKRFASGVASFAEWRWGSTVCVLRTLLPLGPLLRRAWDPTKFRMSQEGDGQDLAPNGEAEQRSDVSGTVDASVLTQAIRSNWFWCFGKMILQLNEISTRFLSWAEGCPCHPWGPTHERTVDEKEQLEVLELFRKDCGLSGSGDGFAFKPCPLAGCRAFELANGAVKEQLQQVAAMSHEQILSDCEYLTEEQIGHLLDNFESAKNVVLASTMNKLQHWSMLPWRLVLLSDPDEDQARRAAANMIEEFDALPQQPELHHRLTWHCFKQCESFRAELDAFVAGAQLQSLPQVKRLAFELHFIPVVSA